MWCPGCMSLRAWEVTGAWIVVALAVDTRWVAGCGVVSLGGWVVFSRVLEPGSTLTRNTEFLFSSPAPAGRVEAEAEVATVSVPMGSGAVGTTVRSPMSCQVE